MEFVLRYELWAACRDVHFPFWFLETNRTAVGLKRLTYGERVIHWVYQSERHFPTEWPF